MKKQILYFSLLTAVCGGLAGCSEDDKVGQVPVYGDIKVSENIYTGQYAEAQVSYKSAGAYVLWADCSYTISSGGTTYSSKLERIPAPGENAPSFRFQAPYKEGNYKLSFSAKFSFYADLPNGTIYGQSNSVDKNFRVLRADAVNACWGDTKERLASVLDVKDTIIAGETLKRWAGDLFFNNQTLTIYGKRLYYFDVDGKLDEMEEIAKYPMLQDDTSLEDAFPYLLDIIKFDDGYEPDVAPVLTGTAAAEYPVSDWSESLSATKKATIINAFREKDDNGDKRLEKYERKWSSDKTQCTVSVYEQEDSLVFKRNFIPLN